jgi:hypothetical protein
VEVIFVLAVALSAAALTPLALPLLGVARDVVRPRSPGADGVAAAPGASSQLEVERFVRGRLYGDRADLAVTPIPRAQSTTRR